MSSVIALEYINHGFQKKYKGVQAFSLWMAGFLTYFVTVTLLNRFSRFEGVIGLLYGGILFLYRNIENQKSVSYNPQLSKDKSVGKKFESPTVRVINGQTDFFKHFNQMNLSKS